MPWKSRRLDSTEKENEPLRTVVIQLRDELRTKQTALSSLELALQARHQTIDALNGQLERVREQNRRLDAEAEHYFQMLAAG
jgi:hypothetical protein